MENVTGRPAPADPGIWVGTLRQWDPTTGRTSNPVVDIYSNIEVFIGRDRRYCQYFLREPHVSGKHIRLYTIIFDEGRPDDVWPLVYAQDTSLNGTYWNNHRMRKGTNGNYLLSHGDVLHIAPNIHIQFYSALYPYPNKFTGAQEMEIQSFHDTYVVTHRLLGSGAFGRVHLAYKTTSGHQLACKVIDLQGVRKRIMENLQSSKFFPNSVQSLVSRSTKKPDALSAAEKYIRVNLQRKTRWYQREASILARLSHPNIIQVEKIIRSENALYIFSELLTGGDLFSFIAHNGGKLDESTSALVVRQVSLALEYLHDQNIVHRDVKPDNILMSSLKSAERVVLADFGCAKRLRHPDQRISTRVGTLQYCAPELSTTNTKGYGIAVDLWSLGCVMAVMLVGYAPFDDPYKDLNSELESLEEDLKVLGTSMGARGLLASLLISDDQLRMDIKEALSHPWLAAPSQARRLNSIHQHMLLEWEPRNINAIVLVDINDLDGNDARVASVDSTPEPEQTITPPISRLKPVDYISETSYEEPNGRTNTQLRSPISLSSPAIRNDSKSATKLPTILQAKPPINTPYQAQIVIPESKFARIEQMPMGVQDLAQELDFPKVHSQTEINTHVSGIIGRHFLSSRQDTGPPSKIKVKSMKGGLYDIPIDEEGDDQVY